MTSVAVAVGVAPGAGTTIVIVTRAHVAHCAALSRIADDMFVATIGAGVVADSPAASPLGSSRWARARSYLVNDPIAIAIERDDQRVLAAAQPKPLAGWLTIDAVELPPIERYVRAWIARQRGGALATFASNLVVESRKTQLLVRTTKLQPEELALATADVLRMLESVPTPPTVAFPCPAVGNGIVRCSGNEVTVTSLASTLRKLVAVDTEPVVAAGDVVGIRLTEDAEVLLRRGDVILGLDGQRIISAAQLQELARIVHDRTALAIRRDGADLIIGLSE